MLFDSIFISLLTGIITSGIYYIRDIRIFRYNEICDRIDYLRLLFINLEPFQSVISQLINLSENRESLNLKITPGAIEISLPQSSIFYITALSQIISQRRNMLIYNKSSLYDINFIELGLKTDEYIKEFSSFIYSCKDVYNFNLNTKLYEHYYIYIVYHMKR